MAVILWGMSEPSVPQNGLAQAFVAILVVFVVTVIPWLIFKMVEQGIADIRRSRSKPARIEPVFTELLDNRVPDSGVLGDSRPRIGQGLIDVGR